VGVLNLEAYKTGDIQTFISLLNQFEAEGVSDVRFVRQRLSRSLTRRAGTIGRVIRQSPPRKAPDFGTCPDCDYPLWPVVTGDNSVKIIGCKKCRFSKVVE